MRFQERSATSTSQRDFVPRERRNYTPRIIISFCLIIFLLLLFGFMPTLANGLSGYMIAAICVTLLAIYVVMRTQLTLDLIMTTEYQNLLFSQALALGTSFCLFARRDGTIMYANEGVRSLFGHGIGESQALDSLFIRGNVAATDRERIMSAIYSNQIERIVFPMTIATGKEKKFVMTVEPIARPIGYVLIRGREYRGERSGTQMMPDMLRTTSPDKLDHLLSQTPIGHYATDSVGRFEYVNPAFETFLGYAQGEIIAARVTLPQVLVTLADHAVTADYTPSDFKGVATLQLKSRGTHPAILFQTVMRDEKGRVTGASGSMVDAESMS